MRLGLLLPSSNTTMEPEFYSRFSDDISLHVGRLKLAYVDIASLDDMKNNLAYEVEKLKDADVDFIIYGCTSGSLLHGKEYSDNLIQNMNKILSPKAKSITTSQCVLNTLVKLNVQSIGVITPYIDEINLLERKFLEQNGYSVTFIHGMSVLENLEIGRITKSKLSNFIYNKISTNENSAESLEALFISCTNLKTFQCINDIETELNIPVFSSNSSSLFEIVKSFPHVDIDTTNLGSIFNSL